MRPLALARGASGDETGTLQRYPASSQSTLVLLVKLGFPHSLQLLCCYSTSVNTHREATAASAPLPCNSPSTATTTPALLVLCRCYLTHNLLSHALDCRHYPRLPLRSLPCFSACSVVPPNTITYDEPTLSLLRDHDPASPVALRDTVPQPWRLAYAPVSTTLVQRVQQRRDITMAQERYFSNQAAQYTYHEKPAQSLRRADNMGQDQTPQHPRSQSGRYYRENGATMQTPAHQATAFEKGREYDSNNFLGMYGSTSSNARDGDGKRKATPYHFQYPGSATVPGGQLSQPQRETRFDNHLHGSWSNPGMSSGPPAGADRGQSGRSKESFLAPRQEGMSASRDAEPNQGSRHTQPPMKPSLVTTIASNTSLKPCE